MNKGAKCISYTHLVKNNVVHLSLEIMWLQVNKHKRSDNLTFYGPWHITSTKEGLPPRIPCMQAMSPIQWRQTSTNQRATRGCHMDWRAHEHPNHLKTMWTSGTDLRTHRTASHTKAQAEVGPQGSVEPTLCRLILAFHVVLLGLSWNPFPRCWRCFYKLLKAYE
jgi:hypothetical protein